MTDVPGFFESWLLWRDAMGVALLGAGMCAFLGVYIVVRRVVFVSAALSQMSGLGVALAFYIASLAGVSCTDAPIYLNPVWYALVFAALGAVLFSLRLGSRRMASGTLVGLGYGLAGSLAILVLNSPQVIREAHEVNDLLYGNAVAVSSAQLVITTGAALVIALLHGLFGKEFLFVSFDAEMARTLGIRTGAWNTLLYLTFALGISVSTRVIGALPVFAFTVIPAAAALMLADRVWSIFVVAVVIGLCGAAGGYYASFRWSLPTGAAMVVVSALFLLPGALRRLARGRS